MPRSYTYNPDAARFGDVIRDHRERLGWTIKKLAQRAGLTPQYVGIVEDGGNVPSLSTVLEILEVLGADTGEVMRYLAEERRKPAKRRAGGEHDSYGDDPGDGVSRDFGPRGDEEPQS